MQTSEYKIYSGSVLQTCEPYRSMRLYCANSGYRKWQKNGNLLNNSDIQNKVLRY